MGRQSLPPPPLAMMALGWAYSAALADMYLRTTYPAQAEDEAGSRKAEPQAPDRQARENEPALTPDEEVLLLHLLE